MQSAHEQYYDQDRYYGFPKDEDEDEMDYSEQLEADVNHYNANRLSWFENRGIGYTVIVRFTDFDGTKEEMVLVKQGAGWIEKDLWDTLSWENEDWVSDQRLAECAMIGFNLEEVAYVFDGDSAAAA